MTATTKSRPLKILALAHEGIGHVNAVLGLAEPLRARGHQIVFVSTETVRHHIEGRGFAACEYLKETGATLPIEFTSTRKDSGASQLPAARNFGGPSLRARGLLSGAEPKEKLFSMLENPFPLRVFHSVYLYERSLGDIIRRHSPLDLILVDHFVASPSIIGAGCPWVYIHSASALYAWDTPDSPPPFSGYPTEDRSRSEEWAEFKGLIRQWHSETRRQVNLWYGWKGLPALSESSNRLGVIESPYLNIYQYPEELDYQRTKPDRWIRVDTYGTERQEAPDSSQNSLKLPREFLEYSDPESRLIYFSLGTLGCFDTNLMRRLISIFGQTRHRFLISKGSQGDQLGELPENMYGANYLPQVQMLALVDLVITHGGNNTFTETFAAGKPMIVMPLFADQYDNAQRVEETGYGRRLNPYTASEEEILDAIEQLLQDRTIKRRLDAAVKRIQAAKSIDGACGRIESLVDAKI